MLTHSLCILVNSNRHPDYVWQLASAADRHGKKVHVHFFGDGLELVDHPLLTGLERIAGVTLSVEDGVDGKNPVSGGLPHNRTDLPAVFRSCARCLVF
jgi:hypothetical protein